MKKILILIIGFVVATNLMAQKTETVVLYDLTPEAVVKLRTVEVVKITKNRVILKNWNRKSRVFRPTNIDLQVGDLFWKKELIVDKRHLTWDDLTDYPSK
jgi:hypothetical protein